MEKTAEHFGSPISTSQLIRDAFIEDYDAGDLFSDNDDRGSETESCFSGFDSDEEVLKLSNNASDQSLVGRDIGEEKVVTRSLINGEESVSQHLEARKFGVQRDMLDIENAKDLGPNVKRNFRITYSTNDRSKSNCLNADDGSTIREFKGNNGEHEGLQDVNNEDDCNFQGFASTGIERQRSFKLNNDIKHNGNNPSKSSCSIVIIPFKTLEKITPWILNKSISQTPLSSLEAKSGLSSCSLPVNEQRKGKKTPVHIYNSETMHAFSPFPPQLRGIHIENSPSKPLIIGPNQPGPDYLHSAPERIEEVVTLEDREINEPECSGKTDSPSFVMMDHTYSSSHDAYLEHNYSASLIHTSKHRTIAHNSTTKETERFREDSGTSTEYEIDDKECDLDVSTTEKLHAKLNQQKGNSNTNTDLGMEEDNILNSSDMGNRCPFKIHVNSDKVMESRQKSPVCSFKSGDSVSKTSNHQAISLLPASGDLGKEICQEVTSRPKSTENTFDSATSDPRNRKLVTLKTHNQEICQGLTINIKSIKNTCNSVSTNINILDPQSSKITAHLEIGREETFKPDFQENTKVNVRCSSRILNLQNAKVMSSPEEFNEKNCKVIILKPKYMMKTCKSAITKSNHQSNKAPKHQSKKISTPKILSQGRCKEANPKPNVLNLADGVTSDSGASVTKSDKVISSLENLKKRICAGLTQKSNDNETIGDEVNNKSNVSDLLSSKVIVPPEILKQGICEKVFPKYNFISTIDDSVNSDSKSLDPESSTVISTPENLDQEICGEITCKHKSIVETCDSVSNICDISEHQHSKVIPVLACNKEISEEVAFKQNCKEININSNTLSVTSDKQKHTVISPAIKLNQEVCKEVISNKKSKDSSNSVTTISNIAKESGTQGRSPEELDQDKNKQNTLSEISKLSSGEEDVEKRRIKNVWRALSSQLLNNVSEFNLLNSGVLSKSKPCESNSSQVKEKCAVTKKKNVFPFDHIHDNHNTKSKSVTPVVSSIDNNVDSLNTNSSISCFNPDGHKSTNNCNNPDNLSESHTRYKQNELACRIRNILKITRRSVNEDQFECFCKYNTVIPKKYRNHCCMESSSKHRFTNNISSGNTENFVYPFDRDLLFNSLGLIEKSSLDNERCLPSLIAHRTRQVRATKTREKEHHKMISQEISSHSSTVSNKKIPEKEHCKMISQEIQHPFTVQDKEISVKERCKKISKKIPYSCSARDKEITKEFCKTVFKEVFLSCSVRIEDISKMSLPLNLNKRKKNTVKSSTEVSDNDKYVNLFDDDVVTEYSFEGFHEGNRKKRKSSTNASVVNSDERSWNRSLDSRNCNMDGSIVCSDNDERFSKSFSTIRNNNNLNNNCHVDESRDRFQRRKVNVRKPHGFISSENSSKRSVYRGKSYSRLCKQYLADCKVKNTSTRQPVCYACQKSFQDTDNLKVYSPTDCIHAQSSGSSDCLQHTEVINGQNASVFPADKPVLDSLPRMKESSNYSPRSVSRNNKCPSHGMAHSMKSQMVEDISIARNVLFPNSARCDSTDFSRSQSMSEDKTLNSAPITGSCASLCDNSIQSVMVPYNSTVVEADEHDQVNTSFPHDSVHSVTLPHDVDMSDCVREKLSEKDLGKNSDQEERLSDSNEHRNESVYIPQNVQLPLSEDLDFVGFDATAKDYDVNENIKPCFEGESNEKDTYPIELEMDKNEIANIIDPASKCIVSLIEGPTCSESGISSFIHSTEDFTLSTDFATRVDSKKFSKVNPSITKKRILRNIKRGSRRHVEKISKIVLRSNVRKRISRSKTNINSQVSDQILQGQVTTSQKENFPDRILTRQRVQEVKLRNSESNSNPACHLNLPELAKSGSKRYNGRFKYNVVVKNGRRWYPCGICSHSFSSSGDMVRHMRRHTGERPFQCFICSRSYTQKGALNKHLETHEGKKPFICASCGARFSQKVHLKSHMRTHTGERPFRCEECGKNFARLDHLKSHENTHSPTRPFKCKVCPLAFKCYANLSKHTRIHLEDRRYRCDYCDASFIVAHSLRMHVRTHTGERPVHCQLCNADFRYESSLRKHVSAKHPEFEVKGIVLIPLAQA